MKVLGRKRNAIRTGIFLAAAVLLVSLVPKAHGAPRPQEEDNPKVTTTSLPDGKVGAIYFQVVEAEGGKVPWTFSQTGCPKGISFDTVRGPNSTDTLNGKPMEAGDFNVTVTVTDSAKPPHSSSKVLKLHINP
jgi:hypothetical protein